MADPAADRRRGGPLRPARLRRGEGLLRPGVGAGVDRPRLGPVRRTTGTTPSSGSRSGSSCPRSSPWTRSDFAPKAWAAAVQLLGGEDRVDLPWRWGDGFIANLGVGDDRPWQPPSAEVTGWHKDGDFFRHFLDSPEQGLLTHRAVDRHAPPGRGHLRRRRLGPASSPATWPSTPRASCPPTSTSRRWRRRCTDFRELTGDAGDVVLMHPYMLHATSQNVIRHGRLITNPPVALREPMRFDRADPARAVARRTRRAARARGGAARVPADGRARARGAPSGCSTSRPATAAEAERLAAAEVAGPR